MKSKSTLLRMLLVLAMLVLCVILIASCEDKPNTPKDTNKPTEDWNDDLPDDLDFEGDKVNIIYWSKDFVENELTADGSTGDVVDIAINDRNSTVEERLNLELNYIRGELPAEVFGPTIRDEIMSGSDDYDIVLGPLHESGAVAAAGAFRDLQNAQYLDFEKDYWSKDYIQSMSVNEKRYMIGGDITLSTTAWTTIMFFFLDDYQNYIGDPNDLYDLVLEGDGKAGGWTFDEFSEMCRKCYVDLNGNGAKDKADMYGFSMYKGSGATQRIMLSSGIELSKRDENNVPTIDIKNRKNIDFFEKYYNFCWSNQGAYLYNMENEAEEDDNNTIFAASAMEAIEGLRGEEKDFGVIPVPKYSADMLNYRSWLSDNSVIAAVPITEPDDRMDIACATLECMASEGNRTVLPAYYEKALKGKYTRDAKSQQMMDIIHKGEFQEFVCSYGGSLHWIGGLFGELVSNQEPNIVSWYESRESQVLADMKKLLDAFNATPSPGEVTTAPLDSTSNQGGSGAESAETHDNQISNSWKVFGSKYRASQKLVKADMTETFDYLINDNDEIEVRSSQGGGYNPTAAIMSKKQVPLNGLSVTFHTDEGFSYNRPANSYGGALSFVWTDSPLTDIPEYLDGIGTNGLRAMIPSGAYALVVSFMGADKSADSISDLMYIILFDGTDPVPEIDNRIGYRWYTQIGTDVSQPISIEVKEDEEAGFVVLINGVEFREGKRGEETLPIDLTALKDKASGGFIAFGAECAEEGGGSNFTVSTINGASAGSYFD